MAAKKAKKLSKKKQEEADNLIRMCMESMCREYAELQNFLEGPMERFIHLQRLLGGLGYLGPAGKEGNEEYAEKAFSEAWGWATQMNGKMGESDGK